jgi:hypothetical protein
LHCTYNCILVTTAFYLQLHCTYNCIVLTTAWYLQLHCTYICIVFTTALYLHLHFTYNCIVLTSALYLQLHCTYNLIVLTFELYLQLHYTYNCILLTTALSYIKFRIKLGLRGAMLNSNCITWVKIFQLYQHFPQSIKADRGPLVWPCEESFIMMLMILENNWDILLK